MNSVGMGIAVLFVIVIALFVLGTALAAYNRKKSESTRYSQQDIIGGDADGAGGGGDADGDGP